jgi:hypothetical protein
MFTPINDTNLKATNGGFLPVVVGAAVLIIGGAGIATPIAIDQVARYERNKLKAEDNALNEQRQQDEQSALNEHAAMNEKSRKRENFLAQKDAFLDFYKATHS